MQRPLTAAPGPSLVYGAADILLIKDAVVIHDFHLHRIAAYAPVFFLHLLSGQAQLGNHPFLIIFVQRNRGFALAAEAATGAVKNIRKREGYFLHDAVLSSPWEAKR